MKKISLTQGKFALVSDRDYARVRQRKWFAVKSRNTWYAKTDSGATFLHRFILRVSEGVQVDHRDGNGLHNTRSNLRVCTVTENRRNRKVNSNKKYSKYKGVFWHKRGRCWDAKIYVGELFNIGSFRSEKDAAMVYDLYAVRHFKRFARLNRPEDTNKQRRAAYARRLQKSPLKHGYRGVTFHAPTGRWGVNVWHAGRQHSGQYHDTVREAARRADELRLKLKGPSAKVNFKSSLRRYLPE